MLSNKKYSYSRLLRVLSFSLTKMAQLEIPASFYTPEDVTVIQMFVRQAASADLHQRKGYLLQNLT